METTKEVTKFFSMGYFNNENFNDKLVLLSLVALVYTKTKEKNSKATCSDVITQITKGMKHINKDFVASLSSLVEELCYGVKHIDSCGMNTSQEVIKKIKEILSTWTPF